MPVTAAALIKEKSMRYNRINTMLLMITTTLCFCYTATVALGHKLI